MPESILKNLKHDNNVLFGMVTGSKSRNYNDSYSDTEVLLAVKDLSNNNYLDEWLSENNVNTVSRFQFEHTTSYCLFIKDAPVDLDVYTLNYVQQVIADFQRYNISLKTQNMVFDILNGDLLFGEKEIQTLRDNLFLSDKHQKLILDKYIEAAGYTNIVVSFDRKDYIAYTQGLLTLIKYLFHILLAINKLLFHGYKHQDKLFEAMMLKPERLHQRIATILSVYDMSSIHDLRNLYQETISICSENSVRNFDGEKLLCCLRNASSDISITV